MSGYSACSLPTLPLSCKFWEAGPVASLAMLLPRLLISTSRKRKSLPLLTRWRAHSKLYGRKVHLANFLLLMDQEVLQRFCVSTVVAKENLSLNTPVLFRADAVNLGCWILEHNDPQPYGNTKPWPAWSSWSADLSTLLITGFGQSCHHFSICLTIPGKRVSRKHTLSGGAQDLPRQGQNCRPGGNLGEVRAERADGQKVREPGD